MLQICQINHNFNTLNEKSFQKIKFVLHIVLERKFPVTLDDIYHSTFLITFV